MIRAIVLLLIVCLSAVGFGFWLVVQGIIQENREWSQFSKEHCRIVAQTKDATGFTSGGQVVFIAGTTFWLCDDGVTYER